MQNPFDQGYYETPELRTFGFAHVGENVRIGRNCVITGIENISIGDGSRIDHFCTIVANGGSLVIGRYVHIHTSVVIGCRGGVTFGDYSAVSHNCQILSASDNFFGHHMCGSTVPAELRNPTVKPVSIGAHVAIGTNCTVLPGATIGEGAAICAFSRVDRSIPEWMMAQGIPARARVPRNRRIAALADGLTEREHAA